MQEHFQGVKRDIRSGSKIKGNRRKMYLSFPGERVFSKRNVKRDSMPHSDGSCSHNDSCHRENIKRFIPMYPLHVRHPINYHHYAHFDLDCDPLKETGKILETERPPTKYSKREKKEAEILFRKSGGKNGQNKSRESALKVFERKCTRWVIFQFFKRENKSIFFPSLSSSAEIFFESRKNSVAQLVKGRVTAFLFSRHFFRAKIEGR